MLRSLGPMFHTSSPTVSISDKIKEILYTKSAEKIDAARPFVGAELFGDEIPEVEEEPTDETEVTNELETEEEPQEEDQENDN